ncbi:hypothetical protein GCM10020000_42610 [Streptomyces olivoverticillatus]
MLQCAGTCNRQDSHQWWQETVRSAVSGGGLDDAGQPRAGGDLGGADAAVVADAVDVDGELLGRVDGDAEVQGLAGGDGAGRGEALDLAVDVVGGAGPGSAGRWDAAARGGRPPGPRTRG